MSHDPTLPAYITSTGLLHDYYLCTLLQPTLPLLPNEATDHALAQARATANEALATLTTLWQTQHVKMKLNESNVQSFVAEVCHHILGMAVSTQGSIPREGSTTQRVDLVLFADDAAVNEFAARTAAGERASVRYADALAVVEVEKVGKELSPSRTTHDNPTKQLVDYLTYTGVPWGILTDGHRWRVLRRFDPPRYDMWVEVHLADILAIDDTADQEQQQDQDQPTTKQRAFWWFVALFGNAAFNRHGRQAGLDAMYDQSERHAMSVQESLRVQAYRVVEELARGIYTTHPAPQEANLADIYEQAIIILYRLLFLKYAEDCEMLPVYNRLYRQYYGYLSVQDDLLNILDDPSITPGVSAESCIFWIRLMYLFECLNTGHSEMGMASYNGHLFRTDRIAHVTIPDAFLARAIDHLARVTRNGSPLRISYRDMDTRHLGSIYEGLLEQHLERANGTLQMVSTAGDSSNRRRTSGSYYTPDYIVDYIVRQTIDPLCENKTADEIAQMTILDPSMGSGHFLVAALTRLAEHHARALKRAAAPTPPRAPGATDAAYRDLCDAYEARLKPSEDEIAESGRMLIEHCIYGVDLNPLAVELAKLSLWLSTVSRTRALSFLDHHLRVGNSLVGARLEHLASRTFQPATANGNTRQMGLFEQVFARVQKTLLNYFKQIADLPTETADQVHAKEQAYDAFRTFSAPFRLVANLWVSQYFGVSLSDEQYDEAIAALDDLYGNGNGNSPDTQPWETLRTSPWFLEAQEKVAHYTSFHWELEFPQVFLREQGGFDVVVGNPPYIRIQHMPALDVAYFSAMFASPSANYDIYIVFIEQALRIVKQSHPVGFIVPHKFITTAYGKKLCRLLADTYYVEHLVHFGDVQVFAGATNYVCILFVRNEHHQQRQTRFIQVDQLTTNLDTLPVTHIAAESLQGERWVLVSDDKQLCMHKIQSRSTPLGKFSKTHYCLFTGLNDAFVVTGQQVQEHKLEQEVLKPLLRGQDIQRWEIQHKDLYIIYPYVVNSGSREITPVAMTAYPNVHRYLLQFKDKLVNRIRFEQKVQDKKERQKRFFEYIDPRHPDQFEITKLIVPEIKPYNAFVLDQENFYALNKAYVVKFNTDMHNGFFLNALLNSKVLNFFYHQIAVVLQNGFYEYTTQHIEQLPIRRIHFTTPQDEREQRVQTLIAQTDTMTGLHAPLFPVQTVEQFRATEVGQAVAALLPMDEQGQFLAFVDGATGQEEHSDVVHDVLAHLAQRMIDLNKQRQQHRTNLLTDLEGIMDASDWSKLGKTRQLWNPRAKKAQAASDAATVLGSLQSDTLTIDDDSGRLSREQFQWLLKHKLGRVRRLASLLSVYDKYHPQIAALEHQRTATDMLIDQLVYLLYGLTPDEVAVIDAS